ncbi:MULTISPECIES: hypothetical protein [unclassified Streptomyces]|uniref:hypothetical protein n=1 Tax=unclassified Streptomyces TaxID=2593676 RepID=UPI00093EC602|nr:hypothetical protein [Streptomyces sp. TSRI0281]OKI32122.1 hypothetical protein A6A29_21485 [Streptomyces sp. TSRI0281]
MEPGDSARQIRAATQLHKGVLEYRVLALMRNRPRYDAELLHEFTRVRPGFRNAVDAFLATPHPSTGDPA